MLASTAAKLFVVEASTAACRLIESASHAPHHTDQRFRTRVENAAEPVT